MNLPLQELKLTQIENFYPQIGMGKFSEIEDHLEKWIAEGHHDEIIFTLMKQLRFWIERIEKLQAKKLSKQDENKQLLNDFKDYEFYLKKYELYHKDEYILFKQAIYNRMIDNHIYLFNHQDKNHPEDVLTLSQLLIEIGEYEKAEETLIYLRKINPKYTLIDITLANLFYLEGKKKKSLQHLKDVFFWHEFVDFTKLNIDELNPLINQLLAENFTHQEICVWLPVYAKLNYLLEENSSISKITFKKMTDKIERIQRNHQRNPNKNFTEPLLIYSYIYLLDQVYLRYQKGNKEFKNDISSILYKIANLNHDIYQKLKERYN